MKKAVHLSVHKCLTVYFTRVCNSTFNRYSFGRDKFRSFGGKRDQFLENRGQYRIASIDESSLRFEELEQDAKVSMFIRDPRDLIVSCYHYHKRGAEAWCYEKYPRKEQFRPYEGAAEEDTPIGESLYEHLNRVSLEDGLIAEIKLRKMSFAAQRSWMQAQTDRVLVLKYEDILGNEVESFRRLALHYSLSAIDTQKFLLFAKRNSASRKLKLGGHMRDPKPSQWRNLFTPKVEAYFNEHQSETLSVLGYD